MKQSKVFISTMGEVPSEAEALGHQLSLKASLIKQSTSGIYSYLPLATCILNHISRIIREETENIDAVEILMPALQQAELWEESGRWGVYGPELMRLKDRNGREFALRPTHEEVVTSITRDELESYKQLPLILFQIQSRFRDKKCPRSGLLRGREFIMKDAYSLYADETSLDQTYQEIYNAYSCIFERVGINACPVVADSGAIGDHRTHELIALSEIGEDTIVYSENSDYAANIEKAEVKYYPNEKHTDIKSPEKIETPNIKTAQELADFLNRPIDEIVRIMIFKVDGEFMIFLVRGHHELNDVKAKTHFETDSVEMATQDEIVNLLGANPGSLGPTHNKDVKIIADNFVKGLNNIVIGTNEGGYHYINANVERDFNIDEYGDFRFILEGEPLSDGSGNVKFAEGTKVGQVLKLGTKYSEAMNAKFIDNQGKAQPLIMGCYGIGVSRTLSAIVEQNNDENGIIWPKSVTPFDLYLITTNPKREEQLELGDKLYSELQSKHDVLYNDRKERAGVKLNDVGLIGLPIRIVVGKNVSEGIVEVKVRQTGGSEEIHINELDNHIASLYGKL